MVFKNIADNVKSFFQKEQELSKEPKGIPDAAIEVFENAPGAPTEHKIVHHNLKVGEAPKAKKKLPFSPSQLRERLEKREQKPDPVPEKKVDPAELESEIDAFEAAIDGISDDSPTAEASTKEQVLPTSSWNGFFEDFSQFMKERGYDIDESMLSHEMLSKMKSFHEDRLRKEKHAERSETLERSLSMKLAELQELERDWAQKQEAILAAREHAVDLEEKIGIRTAELRELVSSMKAHTRALPEPESGPAFTTAHGERIYSLQGLHDALQQMPDDVFLHHVTAHKNDFAVWIRDALHRPDISSRVAVARTKSAFLAKLALH